MPTIKPNSNYTNFNNYDKKNKETSDLISSWVDDGNEEAKEQIFKDLHPTISTALTSYAGGDKSLLPRAYILAGEAIKSYDSKSGTALKSHVYNNLKRLYRVKADRSEVVHVPENVRFDAMKVYKFQKEFVDKYDRDPDDTEIADGTGLSLRKIKKTKNYGKEIPASLAINEKGDNMHSEKVDAQSIWQDYVYHDLDPTNRLIFQYTTGYNDSPILKKKEIAAKLKISPAAVSQRISTIKKRLEQGLEN